MTLEIMCRPLCRFGVRTWRDYRPRISVRKPTRASFIENVRSQVNRRLDLIARSLSRRRRAENAHDVAVGLQQPGRLQVDQQRKQH